MAAREKESQINLLPQKEFASSTLGRILNWVLSTFRIIVIVTEIIVMIAFLSRFWLDAKNTDLNDEIKQKQAFLAASLPFEKDFKDTQKRLAIFSNIANEKPLISGVLNQISSFLPPDVLLNSTSFNGKSVEIAGLTQNETSIQQFVVNLQSGDFLQNVALSEVMSSEKEAYLMSFKVRAEIKRKEN